MLWTCYKCYSYSCPSVIPDHSAHFVWARLKFLIIFTDRQVLLYPQQPRERDTQTLTIVSDNNFVFIVAVYCDAYSEEYVQVRYSNPYGNPPVNGRYPVDTHVHRVACLFRGSPIGSGTVTCEPSGSWTDSLHGFCYRSTWTCFLY